MSLLLEHIFFFAFKPDIEVYFYFEIAWGSHFGKRVIFKKKRLFNRINCSTLVRFFDSNIIKGR